MIDFKIDSKQLEDMATFVAAVNNTGFIKAVSGAMTFAAFDAQEHLKAVTPQFVDNPTDWTLNSTFVKRAKPSDLSVHIGFKDWATKGTPAAQYLQPIAGGDPRRPKRFERALQRRGLLRPGEFVVPADVYPLRLNSFGNLSGSTYTQVLSRIGALSTSGSDGNATQSARSRAARGRRDYFIGQPGGLPRGIYVRVGARPKGSGVGRPVTVGSPRGFHTAFYITRQPNYQQQFPVQQIIASKFGERFPSIFERLIQKAGG